MSFLEFVLFVGAIYIGYKDFKTMRICNGDLIALFAIWMTYVIWKFFEGYTFSVVLLRVFSGICVAFIFMIPYVFTRKKLGGGDLKFAFIIGLYLGFFRGIMVVFYGMIPCICAQLYMKKKVMPLGPFLAIGACFVILF